MNKINLEKCFEGAKRNNAKFIGIKFNSSKFIKDELIIIPKVNFDERIKYFINKYTNDLKLISDSKDEVRITAFTYGDSLDDIEKDLF